MGIAATAGVGIPTQRVLHLRFVQRVVQLGNRRCRITKCRMSGDVFHSLAVDIDLATILQAFQILFPVNGRWVLARKSSGFMSTSTVLIGIRLLILCVVFVIQLKLAGAITEDTFGTMAGTFQVGYGFVIEVAFSDF